MSGTTYSAGTIFLQVVPVFGDVQHAIKRQVKDIDQVLGDDLEKSGEKAGARLGDGIEKGAKGSGKKAAENYAGEFQTELRKSLDSMEREIKPIKVKVEKNELRREFAEIKADLAALGKAKIGVDLDAKEAYGEMVILEGRIKALQAQAKNVEFKTNLGAVERQVDAFLARVRKNFKDIEIPIHLDTPDRELGAFEKKLRETAKRAAHQFGEPINQEMAEIKRKLATLGDAHIGVDISAEDARAQLAELAVQAKRLSMEHPNIQVKIDAGAAAVELIAFDALARKIDSNDVNVKVDVNDGAALGKLAALKAGLAGLGGDGEQSANAFRSFNAVILAAVSLLPALVPILAAVAGGLLAIGPLAIGAGAGIGTMLVGFSGISAAVTAMGQNVKKSAADQATAAATIRSALYGVRDAQQAVGDAERNAARAAADSARAVAAARQSAANAIRSALEQQQQAQESYAQSVKSVQDAEQALRDARDQAKKDQQSTGNAIADNKLAIRQAVLGAFDATTTLNAVMADGSSTKYDKEQAKLAYDQAQQQLKELRQTQAQLAKDKKKQDKEGINGSDAVQQAQDAVTQALQAQQDAQRALGDAARAVDQARVSGAQAVQQALLQQSRSQADGQRSVSRAQEQLRRAQENYNDALKRTGDIGSSSAQNLRDAMKKLGPEGRRFARFVYSLQQGFFGLRRDIQAAMLPPVQHAVQQIINKYGPQLHDFFVGMAGTVGRFFKHLVKSFDSPSWQAFGRVMDKLGPKFFALFGKTTITWLKIFARLMADAAPFSAKMATGLLGMSKSLSKFLDSKRGREGVEHFMEYAAKIGPKVLDFLGNFVKAAVNLARALAPWGAIVLTALDGFFKLIAKIPPKDLGLIVTSLIGLFVAFQVGVGAAAASLGVMALIADPVGLLIAAVVAAVIIVSALYVRFKAVRVVINAVIKVFIALVKWNLFIYKTLWKIELAIVRFIAKTLHLKQIALAVWGFLKKYALEVFGAVVKAINWVGDEAVDLWKKYLQPAFEAIGKVLKKVWETVLQPIFAAIGDVIGWVWHHVFQPAFKAIGVIVGAAFKLIKGYWTHVLWPVLDLMIHIVMKLWQKVWKPALDWMVHHWGIFSDAIHWAWAHVLKPVFDAIGRAVHWLNDKVFQPVLGAIGAVWDRVIRGLVKVYDNTLKPMIDKFIDLMGGKEGLQSKFETVVGAIKTLWSGLKKIFAAPIKFVLDTVINKGLIGGFNKVADFVGSTPIKEIPIPAAIDNAYARGGVLPGYTPGRDPHTFVSPTGGRLHLSGGEAIMRPEWTKAVGPGFVQYMNQLAASGGVQKVKKAMGAGAGHFFAKGGVFENPDAPVMMGGKKIAAIAAAQIILAEKLNRRKYYLMQGGYGGDGIAASGTSHNYPGVADIAALGGINFADQTMLRKVGFAAWARNIPGAAYVGTGEHVHSASFFSPGTQSSPQLGEYINGGNGLGGSDYGPRPNILPGIAEQLSQYNLPQIVKGAIGHGPGFGLPGWLIAIAKDPLGYFTHKVTDPMKEAASKFGSSDFLTEIAGVPIQLVKNVANKVIGMIPGGSQLMSAAGNTIKGIENVGGAVGGALSDGLGHLHFAKGGVLPYNGTMMYDQGGYLPPGLTSVVNLTGKPEPVFTHDQMANLPGSGGGGLTYAPTFTKATPNPEELMDDLEFTIRKLKRSGGGRYAEARGANA